MLGMSISFRPSAQATSSTETSLIPGLAVILPSPGELLSWKTLIWPSLLLCLRGCLSVDLSLPGFWGLSLSTSTPAQNVCEGCCGEGCCCLSYILQPGPVMPGLSGAGRRFCLLLAARLSTSVNQQTLPRACSGLSIFPSSLGRVWGRKSGHTH